MRGIQPREERVALDRVDLAAGARSCPPSSVGPSVAKAGSRFRRSASASGPRRMSLKSSTFDGSPTPTSQRRQSAGDRAVEHRRLVVGGVDRAR